MAIINPAELDLQEEAVVKVNRTAKVTSRGKRFRFSALVVVGDGKGHIGVGLGKANEVISAIQKGKEAAKQNIVKVSLLLALSRSVFKKCPQCGEEKIYKQY